MDPETLAAAWRERLDAESARVRERAERARRDARTAAAALVDELGAREVWLFGSLLGEPRHADFDVDLAVLGIRPGDYFQALARATGIVGRPVDLVTLETAPPALARKVRQRGARIDGR